MARLPGERTTTAAEPALWDSLTSGNLGQSQVMAEVPQTFAGPLFERVPAASRGALLRILKDVQTDRGGSPRAFFGEPSWKVPLQWGNPVSPWETEFVLKDIIGCDDFGRGEKLAWEYALRYEGVPMTLAFQKFGMRAYIDIERIDEPGAVDMASRLALTIGRALPLLRKTVLSAIADEQISRGEINVDNHLPRLKRQYEHFRNLSSASLLAASVAEPIREEQPGPPRTISVRLPSIELEQQAGYESNAALSAFFSMLEHLLLIEFLLSGREADGGRLGTFLASGWKAKFKYVMDLEDPQTKVQYDKLAEIHDQARNRSVHGGVHSDGTDFNFLLPGVGPVSAHLVISGRKRTYRWSSKTTASSVQDVLDEVGGWLENRPLGPAITYGESGLPLFFGSGLRNELVEARRDPASLLTIIENLRTWLDNSANMDW